PIPRDALPGNEAGDVERRVDAEGGGGHGRPGEPPRERTARDEEVRHRSRASPREVEPQEQGGDEVDRDDDPVDQTHGRLRPRAGTSLARGPGHRPNRVGGFMSHPVAGSVLDNVFYTIGYALGEAE